MKSAVLPLLCCPRQGCSGSLAAQRSGSGPPERALAAHRSASGPPERATGEELLEGSLVCAGCRTEYPVLSGVAVLVPRPEDYLRRYHRAILRDLDRHGELSAAARTWLVRGIGEAAEQDDYGADFRFSQQFEEPWNVAQACHEDPAELYGPFADWLRGIRSPYDVLASWAAELPGDRHLLLDAGCGGGGLVARTATHYGTALGVDFSFLAVLLARRAVLHRPEAERSYFLSVRRGQDVERPLTLPKAENAEFVVGDCRAVPFPAGLFDAVLSSNVIDIAGIDRPLDEAARTLRTGGRLLLSDPFYFRDREAPAEEPRAAVQKALQARGLAVEAEQDGVPWAWATYDRHWRIYFNYCVAARKS